MSFESELRTHIIGHAPISALIGARFHPDLLPQETVIPAAVYQIIIDVPQTDLDGADGELSKILVQIDIYARNKSDAMSIRDAIRSRMKTAASGFKAVPMNAGQSIYEPDTKLYRYMMEFSCWWRIT